MKNFRKSSVGVVLALFVSLGTAGAFGVPKVVTPMGNVCYDIDTYIMYKCN